MFLRILATIPAKHKASVPPKRLIEKIVSKARFFRVVIFDRFVELLLRGRDKPRFHRVFRAATISSSVTDAISPLS